MFLRLYFICSWLICEATKFKLPVIYKGVKNIIWAPTNNPEPKYQYLAKQYWKPQDSKELVANQDWH